MAVPTADPVTARRPELQAMWESVLRKAQQPNDPAVADPVSINIVFDGANQPLTVGMGGIFKIPYPCRILSCEMYSATTSLSGVFPALTTATVYLGISTGEWSSGAVPLTGTDPIAMTNIEYQAIDVASWIRELQPGDVLPYSLTAFTGTATILSVVLWLRKLDVAGIGVAGVTDGSDTIVSGSDTVVFRR